MARRIINIGQQGNDGTGDSVRESFRKVNENFQDLYAVFGAGGKIRFTDLDDAPASYTAGNVLFTEADSANNGGQISARSLVAGDGISITTTNPGQIVIASSAGLNSTAPMLTAGLNANQFPIANVPSPDDPIIADIIDAWNITHEASGVIITVDDLLLTKRYADTRYQIVSGNTPLITRPVPEDNTQFVKAISSFTNGNLVCPAHGLTAADTGKAWYFNTNGTIMPTANVNGLPNDLVNGETYYIRYVDASTLSLHTTPLGAANNINWVEVTSSGNGTIEQIVYIDYDLTLSGFWLATEAVPRSEVVLRAGDTMTGALTLSGAPTSALHAASKQYVDGQVAAAITAVSNTDALIEGNVNLFYTAARATTAAQLAMSVVKSGFGSLTYANGVFTYVGPSAAEIRSTLSAGTGVTYSNVTGAISIGQDVATTATPTFATVTAATFNGNVVGTSLTGTLQTASQTNITSVGTLTSLAVAGDTIIDSLGNFSVFGTSTSIDSTTVTITDPAPTIGSTANDNKDRGIEFKWNNGTAARTGFFGFQNSTRKLIYIPDATVSVETYSGTTGTIVANLEGDVTGDVTGTVSSISNHSTTDLAEGTNLYFTNERVDDRVAALLVKGDGISLTYADNGTGAGTLTISADATGGYNLSGNTTDDLTEGTDNKYFTNSRAQDAFTIGAGLVLDAAGVAEGTRQLRSTITQYTDANALAAAKAGFGFDNTGTGYGSLSYLDGIYTFSAVTNADIQSAFTFGTGLSFSDLGGVRTVSSSITQYTDTMARAAITLGNVAPAVGTGFGSIAYDGVIPGKINFTQVSKADIASAFTTTVNSAITLSPNPTTGVITISVDPTKVAFIDDAPAAWTSDSWVEGTLNLYYTDTRVDTRLNSRINTLVTGSGGITGTWTPGTPNLNFTLTNNSITLNTHSVALGGSLSLTTTDITEGTNQYHTTARVQSVIDSNATTTATADKLVKRTAQTGMTGLHIMSAPMSFSIAVGATATLTVSGGTYPITSNLVNATTSGGAGSRKIQLPAVASAAGYWLIISNDGAYTITVENATATTISSIPSGGRAQVVCNGNDWFQAWLV